MDILSSLFNFITDGTKKVSVRSATIVATIIILLFLDNIIGFSYYYNITKKLSTINQISTVLKDTSLKKNNRTYLLNLRNDIIYHKSIKDKACDFLQNSNYQAKYSLTTYGLYSVLNIISATCFPLLMMVAMFIVTIPLLLKKKKPLDDDNKTITVKILGIAALLYVFALIEIKILFAIPLILNNIIFNYCLNIIVNCLFLSAFVLSINSSEKKRAKQKKPVTTQ
jgi:hypothetical protein